MHSQLKTTESALIQLHLPGTQLKKKKKKVTMHHTHY